MNRKYPDIMLLERKPLKVPHQHLIELKYCKKGKSTDKTVGWEAKQQEGIEQVQGYLKLPEVVALESLSAWLLVTDGEKVDVTKLA